MRPSVRRNRFGAVLATVFCITLLAAVSAASAGDKQPQGPSDKIKGLLKERLDTLQKIYDMTAKAAEDGKAPPGAVYQAKMALLNAQLETAPSKEERIKLLEEVVKEAEGFEKSLLKMVADGKASQADALQARVAVIEARISLEATKMAK